MYLKLFNSAFINLLNVVLTINAGSPQCGDLKLWLQTLSKQPQIPFCPDDMQHKTLYLLYDVNPPEGFNLRRDVYIRFAVFIRNLQHTKGFHHIRLVLPPWRRLYHWKSQHLLQDHLAWYHFFNIESLKRYAPVLDYPEFLQEIGLYGLPESPQVPVHKVLQLQHFKNMFESGVYQDKWQFTDDCEQNSYLLRGSYLEQAPLLIKEPRVQCVRFQGNAKLLKSVLQKVINGIGVHVTPKIIAIMNAEVVLHDHWANQQFWQARRSMRFAEHLVDISNMYRLKNFNSSDKTDKVQRPPMWELELPLYSRKASGGSYVAAHLRRADFLYSRESTTPTLKSVASQLKYYLKQSNLSTIFLATDASAFEVKNLKSFLPRIHLVRFNLEGLEEKVFIKDGGIAIIDQLICAHSGFFIGTYESTFTYRIYEEREILGFPRYTTFNTFCKKSSMEDCSKNAVWPIVY